MLPETERDRDRGEAPASDLLLPSRRAHDRHFVILNDEKMVAWEMDARTWRFTFVSPHAVAVFGYPLQRWYDEPTFWQDTLLHPGDREWCVGYCSTASSECRDHAFLYRARAADGRVLSIKDVVKVLPDEAGRPALMRGIMEDVTGRSSASELVHATMTDYDAPDLEPARIVLTGEWWDT